MPYPCPSRCPHLHCMGACQHATLSHTRHLLLSTKTRDDSMVHIQPTWATRGR